MTEMSEGMRWRVLFLITATVADCGEKVGDDFGSWFGAEVAFPVDADAYVSGFEVAAAEDEHRVHFLLLGTLDLSVDLVGAGIEFATHALGAQFGLNRFRVVHQRFFI